MAYVHEIKFFEKKGKLYAALFDKPPFFANEFWIKNVTAKELRINQLPENLELETKYIVAELGMKPFHASKLEFEFMDEVARLAWKHGKRIALGGSL